MKHLLLLLVCFTGFTPFAMNTNLVLAKAPESGKIVFAANRVGNREIYLMNPDGSEQMNITRNKADDVTPVWAPTGEYIAFSSNRDGILDLYLMEADGKNVRRVFGKSAQRVDPTWSPDGKQIAYTRYEQGKGFVYIATIESKKEERMAIGSGPDWSPDGAEIAFLTGWPERMQISILNVSTHKQRVIFPKPAKPSWMGGGVAWSPSGKKLAFSWLDKVPLKDFIKTETIYTVNRDGMGLQQIVPEAGPKVTSPIWSPRGDELLYIQADDVHAAQPINLQIFKIAVDGGEPVQLTHIGLGHHLGGWFDPAFALPVAPQLRLATTIWGQIKQQ